MERTIAVPLLTRAATLAPDTFNDATRSVTVVWSTGARVRRTPWFGDPFDEELSLEPGHVRLDRLNDKAPVLKVHDLTSLEAVIGVVEPGSARIVGGQGLATLVFSDRPEVAPIVGDIGAGILRAVSVGYRVHRYDIHQAEGQPELWRAVDWTPFEISLVPVGADPGAGLRSSETVAPCRLVPVAGPTTHSPRQPQGKKPMTATRQDPAPPELQVCADCPTPEDCRANGLCAKTGEALTPVPNPAPPAPPASPSTPAGGMAVHNRSQPRGKKPMTATRQDPADYLCADGSHPTEIVGDDGVPVLICGDGSTPMPQAPPPAPAPAGETAQRAIEAERKRITAIYTAQTKLGVERTVADDLVQRGIGLNEARAALIDAAALQASRTAVFPHVSIPLGGRDERQTRVEAVTNALLHRFLPAQFKLTDPGRDYRGMTLLELGREFLAADGVRVRDLTRDEIATRSLMATADFPAVLGNVVNRTLRQAYEVTPRTFTGFCRQVLARDFKDMHRVQLGEAPSLEEVPEGGEYKRGAILEAKETYRIRTFGKTVAITRQVILNDDLDAFTRLPALYGAAGANLENDVVWSVFTANPAMADGKALFHADHKNLAGTAASLSVDSIGKARAEMARQTGVDGQTVINVRPGFLIVPAALELKADQLLSQTLLPAKSADVVPPSIRSLTPVSEPRLDAASTTAWFLAANHLLSVLPLRCLRTARSTPSSTPIWKASRAWSRDPKRVRGRWRRDQMPARLRRQGDRLAWSLQERQFLKPSAWKGPSNAQLHPVR